MAVDCWITTKAPCGGEKAGRSPVDRGKRATKRSTAVDANGTPLPTVVAPANRHDSPLLAETLEAVAETLGELPERASVHLDRGYDSGATRERLKERGLLAEISEKGKPAPMSATKRWVVERTNSWHNAHEKLLWYTERRARVVDFWVAFSEVVIVDVRRLVREAWLRYRWEARSPRRPWPIAASSKLIEKAGVLSLSVQREEFPYRYVTVEGTVVRIARPPLTEWMLAIARRYLPEDAARGFVEAELAYPGSECCSRCGRTAG